MKKETSARLTPNEVLDRVTSRSTPALTPLFFAMISQAWKRANTGHAPWHPLEVELMDIAREALPANSYPAWGIIHRNWPNEVEVLLKYIASALTCDPAEAEDLWTAIITSTF